MPVPLEDYYEDIIAKAQVGLQLPDSKLSQLSGVDPQEIRRARRGEFKEEVARKMAPYLQLDTKTLIAAGKNEWLPEKSNIDGLIQYNTSFPIPGYTEMTVNAYLCWHTESLEGILIDTGADISAITQKTISEKIQIQGLLLTHSHRDHIADINSFKSNFPNAYIFSLFPEYIGMNCTEWTSKYKNIAQGLSIEARKTPGHSADGTTWFVQGLSRDVAFSGDALFAGSMGGAGSEWKNALKINEEQIFTLNDSCILCPGHGPMSTIGEEKEHNPLFPQFKES